MNVRFRDSQASEVPERILNCLIPDERGSVYSAQQSCLALNRFGTLLCTGCIDGKLVIYDTDTLLLSEMYVPFATAIVRVVFSHCGNYIAAGTIDGCVAVLRVRDGFVVGRRTIKGPCGSLEFNPRNNRQLLVSGIADPPRIMMVDYETMRICPEENDIVIEMPEEENGKKEETEKEEGGEEEEEEEGGREEGEIEEKEKKEEGELPKKRGRRKNKYGMVRLIYRSSMVSTFGQRGKVVYCCSTQGVLFKYSLEEKKVIGTLQIKGQGSQTAQVLAKSIEVSRSGELLLINFNDRVVRLINGNTMSVISEIRDQTGGSSSFTRCTFTGNQNFIVCVVESSPMDLQIYSLDAFLTKSLTGSFSEKIYDVAWNRYRTQVFTSTSQGLIYVWDTTLKEKWDVYVPAFHEIQENTEYIEREDEFDLPEGYLQNKDTKVESKEPKKKRDPVDIVTRSVITEYFTEPEVEDEEIVKYCKEGIPNKGLLITIPPVLVESSLQF